MFVAYKSGSHSYSVFIIVLPTITLAQKLFAADAPILRYAGILATRQRNIVVNVSRPHAQIGVKGRPLKMPPSVARALHLLVASPDGC